MLTETITIALWLWLVVVLVSVVGVVGAAYAFAVIYIGLTFSMLGVVRSLIGFRWSRPVKELLALSALMVALSFGLTFMALGWIANVGGGILTLVGCIISLRGLGQRVGPEHRLIRWLPGSLVGRK